MNYSNTDMYILGDEYWQKKNFLDHLDVNRKLAAAYSMRRIEGILRRMYDDLRFYEPLWFMGTPFLRYLNPELFPKDLMEVVEHIASLAELDNNSVLLAALGGIASALCGCYVVQVDDGWKEAGCLSDC